MLKLKMLVFFTNPDKLLLILDLGGAIMSTLYIVKVIDTKEVYEYEFRNLPHTLEFISIEKQPCTLWIADTVTGNETRLAIPE